MSSAVDGCWAKIKRAKENTDNLADEIRAFVEANLSSYKVITEFDRDAQEVILKAVGNGPRVPDRISVLVGEIVYHLRSSLDHLMWGLVTKRHTAPTWRPQFPIYLDAAKFKAAGNNEAKGLSGKALALIESVQPYHRTPAKSHPLAILHALNITDKHRLLLVIFGVLGHPAAIEIKAKGQFTGTVFGPPSFVRPSKDGTELFRQRIDPFNAEVDVHFRDVTAEVALEEFGVSKLEPVIPSLVHLRQATINVVQLLSSEL